MSNISLPILMILGVGCATKTETDTGSNGNPGGEPTNPGMETGSGTDADADTDDGAGTGGAGGDGDSDDGAGAGGTDDAGTTGGGGSTEIAIAGGYWNTELSNSYTITSESITEVNGPPSAATYVWDISSYDNSDQYIIAQNPAGHWAGDGWTRYDWAIDGTTVYLCATVTDADTEETALAGDFAVWSGDPDSGCPNLVKWMTLTPS